MTLRLKTVLYIVAYAFIMSATLFLGFKEASWPLSALLFFYAGFLTRHVVEFLQSEKLP